MDEIWKTIKGRKRYEISNKGHVRSKDIEYIRVSNGKPGLWHYKGKLLKAGVTRHGYNSISLKPYPDSNENRGQRLVHSLVWGAFGNRQRKGNEDIDHINGIKTDNRIENLRLLTRSENMIAYHKLLGTRGNIRKLKSGMFEARFNINKKAYFCGNYTNKKDARTALKAFLRLFDNEKL